MANSALSFSQKVVIVAEMYRTADPDALKNHPSVKKVVATVQAFFNVLLGRANTELATYARLSELQGRVEPVEEENPQQRTLQHAANRARAVAQQVLSAKLSDGTPLLDQRHQAIEAASREIVELARSGASVAEVVQLLQTFDETLKKELGDQQFVIRVDGTAISPSLYQVVMNGFKSAEQLGVPQCAKEFFAHFNVEGASCNVRGELKKIYTEKFINDVIANPQGFEGTFKELCDIEMIDVEAAKRALTPHLVQQIVQTPQNFAQHAALVSRLDQQGLFSTERAKTQLAKAIVAKLAEAPEQMDTMKLLAEQVMQLGLLDRSSEDWRAASREFAVAAGRQVLAGAITLQEFRALTIVRYDDKDYAEQQMKNAMQGATGDALNPLFNALYNLAQKRDPEARTENCTQYINDLWEAGVITTTQQGELHVKNAVRLHEDRIAQEAESRAKAEQAAREVQEKAERDAANMIPGIRASEARLAQFSARLERLRDAHQQIRDRSEALRAELDEFSRCAVRDVRRQVLGQRPQVQGNDVVERLKAYEAVFAQMGAQGVEESRKALARYTQLSQELAQTQGPLEASDRELQEVQEQYQKEFNHLGELKALYRELTNGRDYVAPPAPIEELVVPEVQPAEAAPHRGPLVEEVLG